MFRRILGLIILMVSLITMVILLAGAFFTGQVVDTVGERVTDAMLVTIETLDTVSLTLDQTRATVVEANAAIETAVSLTDNLSTTISNSRPVLDSMTTVVSEDIPNNIEAIQDALPNVAEVAGVVDNTMTTLSDFGINQTIPIPFNPITLDFDLGIEYEPEEPFDETILSLGESLEGMPQELRLLHGDLEILSTDLGIVSSDVQATSEDLERINAQVGEFLPIIDEYISLLDRITASLVRSQAQILAQLGTVKTVLIISFLFLSLTQIAPLYLGWELITGQRSGQQEETPEVIPPGSQFVVVQDDQPAAPIEQEKVEPAAPASEPSAQEIAEPTYDPAGETIIEGPYFDPAENVGSESQPPDKEDDEQTAS